MRVLGGNTEDIGDDFFLIRCQKTQTTREKNKQMEPHQSQTKIFQKRTILLEGNLEMGSTCASYSPAMMLNIHHSKESLPTQQKMKG